MSLDWYLSLQDMSLAETHAKMTVVTKNSRCGALGLGSFGLPLWGWGLGAWLQDLGLGESERKVAEKSAGASKEAGAQRPPRHSSLRRSAGPSGAMAVRMGLAVLW